MAKKKKQPLTTGGVLHVESLDVTLNNIAFDMKNIVLWPRYWKYPSEAQSMLILLAKLGVYIP